MRTREMGYTDLQFEAGEEKGLMDYLSGGSFKDFQILLSCAEMANKEIAPELFYSIVADVSYERLDTLKYIPINKIDFYAYRRKTLAMVRDIIDAQNERKCP